MSNKRIFTNGKFVAIIATLCCLLWGSAYPSVKSGYVLFNIEVGDIPSKILFAGYRFVLAGIILLVVAQFSGKGVFSISRKDFIALVVLGILQTTFQYIFFYIGVANTSGVKSSMMNSTGTFFSVILAHYIYKNDKLTMKKVIGCIIGFIGVMIVNFTSDLLDFSFSFLGEGFIIISAFFSSVASIYAKRITKTIDVIVVTGYGLFLGGIILVLLGIGNGGKVNNFTLTSSILLIYLAFISSVAFSLWNLLLKYNKVGQVSIFNFLVPIFGAILSAIFLGESILEMKNIVALILVCLGIWMVNKDS